MSYYVIIRGPAGVGKTTIAKKLAKRLGANYVSFDKILKNHNLEKIEKGGMIKKDNFIRANDITIPAARRSMSKGIPVVFDSNFYHKSQLIHLIKNLRYKHFVFTLKADLELCLYRDKQRKRSIGEDAIKAVYKAVCRFDYGTIIKINNETEKDIVRKIFSYLPRN